MPIRVNRTFLCLFGRLSGILDVFSFIYNSIWLCSPLILLVYNAFDVHMSIISYLHSPQECLVWVACLWSKMPMFQRVGMREGGLPLPLTFQYLIFMIWRPSDLNLVMISSLASKCQHFKLRGLQFHSIKWLKNGHPKFKVLAFWSQLRYHNQIQIIRSSYQKNQILKS